MIILDFEILLRFFYDFKCVENLESDFILLRFFQFCVNIMVGFGVCQRSEIKQYCFKLFDRVILEDIQVD